MDLVRKIIGRLLKRMVKKKYGYDVDFDITSLHTYQINGGKTKLQISAEATIITSDLDKLVEQVLK